MQTIRLELEGEPGSISLSAFLTAVRNWLGVLSDLDSALSHRPGGSLEWVITELSTGSLQVAAAARPKRETNIGPSVARHVVRGMQQIEREGTTPPYISEGGLASAKRMLKVIGSSGVTGMAIASPMERVQLSARASANVDELLPPRYASIGSVEGPLEAISLHGKRTFVIYHDRTHKAITCEFPAGWLERVKDALGRRVNVSGVVHWNAKGEQVRLDAEDIRVLRGDDELPSIREMAGSIPDLTGGLTSAEYLEGMHDA